jgi:hypothetical protein
LNWSYEDLHDADEDENASKNQFETEKDVDQSEFETGRENQEVEIGRLRVDPVSDIDDVL